MDKNHPPIKYGKTGVLIINLGTPDSTNWFDIRKYLKEFLSDRRVIEVNPLIWQIILNLFILTFRPSKTAKAYKEIWMKNENMSPLLYYTKKQSEKTSELLQKENLSPQLSDMIQVVDLYDSNHRVVDRVLVDDKPIHILSHPDKKRFIAVCLEHFITYTLKNEKLIELERSKISYGLGCFWIHPNGKNILAARSPRVPGKPAIPEWYEIKDNKVIHINDIQIESGLDTEYLDSGVILRISPDGKRGFICQRTIYNGLDLCDVLIADLTLDRPKITQVIKQVGDGLESFAFHPNGKMAVVTCLAHQKNALAVLDIESDPPRLLYHIDASGGSQGIEFTPEGDKLFHGSPAHGRIEVYDVVGDFELVKNQKFIKIAYGHNSLTMGPRYFPKKNK